MNTPLNSLSVAPPLALLLSSDPDLENKLVAQCDSPDFKLERFGWQLGTVSGACAEYDAVLLDLRPHTDSVPLSEIDDLPIHRPQARIGLFANFEELQSRSGLLPQLDHYILLEPLQTCEFTFHLSVSINRAQRAFSNASEQTRYRALLDNIPDNIYFKDRESRLIQVNKAYCNKFGKKPEDILGKTDFDLFSKEHAAPAFEDEQNIINKNVSIIRKLERETFENGETNWVSTTKVPLADIQGNIIGTMGISRDVSDLKEAEGKLKSTISLLEETQLQLIEAEKLKSVGRMAAGIAHEVKNPLAVVTLGVDYLRQQLKGNDELLGMLNDMKDAITKANDVIFELLDYSSPREMQLEPQHIHTVVEQTLSFLQHNFKQANIKCLNELDADLPQTRIDLKKIEQVFINLLLNCINAMPSGGELVIRSKLTRMQSAGANVSSELTELFRIGDPILQIEIEDNGHGIDDKHKDKLFDPFYSTNSTGAGTGLGLSVTRRILEIHHAHITLENCKNHRGCLTTLYFHPVSQ